MFSLNGFIMKTIKGMIGAYPDFQVREYASNWYSKGVLTEDNLAEIDVLIENQYIELPFVDVTNGEEFTEENSEYTEDNTELESESSYEEV
jgi:hypothetical protein